MYIYINICKIKISHKKLHNLKYIFIKKLHHLKNIFYGAKVIDYYKSDGLL